MQGEKKIAWPSCDFYFEFLPYFDKHSKHTFEYWTITHVPVHLSKYGNLEIYAYVFKLILDIVLTKCNSWMVYNLFYEHACVHQFILLLIFLICNYKKSSLYLSMVHVTFNSSSCFNLSSQIKPYLAHLTECFFRKKNYTCIKLPCFSEIWMVSVKTY